MPKKVLVTGSSRGIGLAIANKFSEQKWEVLFTSRNKNDLQILENRKSNEKNRFFEIDFQKVDQIIRLKEYIEIEWGSLDSLIVNVGNGSGPKTIESSFLSNFEIFKLNFISSYLTANILKPLLLNSSKGSITLIGSIAANSNVKAPINYSIAKKSIENFVKSLSLKFSNQNLLVNVVHPGHVLTENGFWFQKKQENLINFNEFTQKNILVNKMLLPDHIADFVYELTNSEFSNHLTGSSFVIDGGTSIVK